MYPMYEKLSSDIMEPKTATADGVTRVKVVPSRVSRFRVVCSSVIPSPFIKMR
jgi:hypothetical protein